VPTCMMMKKKLKRRKKDSKREGDLEIAPSFFLFEA